jgi:phage shock protein PspC (stress-responsive transcriptional regulator)
MKRVENIHINGVVFNIEDDAFKQLSEYLDALGKYFRHEPGGNEIIADIEARISELFSEREEGAAKVITADNVSRVIAVLGTLEDITGTCDETSDPANPPLNAEPNRQKKMPRRLYRNPDKRFLGGVCAGIAAWVGIHPAIIRTLFVLFVYFAGITVLIYFICWWVIPLAKTTAQKLEMRGEPVNISNIEKNIKEQLSDSALQRSLRQFTNEAGDIITRIFQVVLRIAGIIIGIWLIMWGVGIAVGSVSLFFVKDFIFRHWVNWENRENWENWDFLSFQELFSHIVSPLSYHLMLVCTGLIILLTVAALIFWGIRLISRFKIKYSAIHIGLLIMWLLSIGTLVGVCVTESLQWAAHNEIKETKILTTGDTLYIDMAPSSTKLSNHSMDVYFDKEKQRFCGTPDLHISKSEDEQVRLVVRRRAQGNNKSSAYHNAESINYTLSVQDSLLLLPEYFTVNPANQWKFQSLSITLYLPVGKTVQLSDAVCHSRRGWSWYLPLSRDCKWIVTEKNGLQAAE